MYGFCVKKLMFHFPRTVERCRNSNIYLVLVRSQMTSQSEIKQIHTWQKVLWMTPILWFKIFFSSKEVGFMSYPVLWKFRIGVRFSLHYNINSLHRMEENLLNHLQFSACCIATCCHVTVFLSVVSNHDENDKNCLPQIQCNHWYDCVWKSSTTTFLNVFSVSKLLYSTFGSHAQARDKF